MIDLRWIGVAIAAGVVAGAVWIGYRLGAHSVQTKFDAYVLAADKAAVRQSDANRERSDSVVEKVVVQTVYRDRFITKTVKEIERVTEPLATCPVPPAARKLLISAAACAREDRPAACGADDPVRDAK